VFLFRLLLGGGPPPFDQLQDCLAAVPQSLALPKLVKQGDDLARQRDDELVMSTFGQPPTIGAVFLAYGCGLHDASGRLDSLARL
jgi:hypothetical protein